MLTIVINLLLSIAIGNVLHAMDEEKVDDVKISLKQSRDVIQNKQFAVRIKTLADMTKLPQDMFDPSKKPHSNFPQDIRIDLSVFDEFAYEKGLITNPNPGMLKRILCCWFGKKSRFLKASPDFRRQLSKGIVVDHYNLKKSIIKNIPANLKNKNKDNVFGSGPESLKDNDNIDAEKSISLSVIEIVETFSVDITPGDQRKIEKYELLEKMHTFLANGQRHEDNVTKCKACCYALTFTVGIFLLGAYSLCL